MDALSPRERHRLDNDGHLAFEGLIDPARVRAMRSRLEELLAVTKQDHAGTLIVGGLFVEPVFDAAWQHPRVLAAVRRMLGDDHRLLGLASRGLRPGHGQQALHVDWGGQGTPGVWYACHAICALVDFTEENGATRVLPGSHRNPRMLRNVRDPRGPHPDQRQLVGPAGTVFVLNIHCVHSAVQNTSDTPRHALFAHFSRRDSPLLLADSHTAPGPETLARFDQATRAILLP